MLRNKTPAPDFSLPDENGTCHDLTQLREGKLLIIFFFAAHFARRRDAI
jgi:peroxiredoxin